MIDWKYRKRNKTDIDRYFDDLRSFFQNLFDDISSVNEGISKLDQISIDPRFDELANLAARNIITYQANANARTWREAARKSSKGRKLYKYLRKELNKNDEFNGLILQSADLIKTLPRNIATRVVKRVTKLGIEGKRAYEISEDIKKYFPEATKASATLIARTQVAKTYAYITETRAKSVGVTYYIWHTVGGPRVRDSHQHMNNVIVFYSDPPSPEELIGKKSQGRYHAGGIYNCRCYEEPVLDIEDVSFPHKVYSNGKITRMSKKQFMKLVEKHG